MNNLTILECMHTNTTHLIDTIFLNLKKDLIQNIYIKLTNVSRAPHKYLFITKTNFFVHTGFGLPYGFGIFPWNTKLH